MRAVGFFLVLILASPAFAFQCAGVSKPSTIVICSDPELIRLADERQQAINETRARIGEERWGELWENQKTWVRTYSAACGVADDRSPPLPVPASIRECFRRAALDRIAFIRGYGVAAAGGPTTPRSPVSSPSGRLGPGFDCSKALRPLALMICADDELSVIDLRFNQAYWALYQQLDEADRKALKVEDAEFIDKLQDDCRLPRSGELTDETWRGRACVRTAFLNKRTEWLSELSGPAREEATRPPERHISLERKLRQLGYLAGAVPPDGVYGPVTRAAITQWQAARGRTTTGCLSEADARALEGDQTDRQGLASLSAPGKADEGRTPEPLPPSLLPKPQTAERTEIALEPDRGTYRVPVRINDQLTLKFTIDTGASDVMLPADVVLTLSRTETIKPTDFIDSQTYVTADGTASKNARFILRKLQVGAIVLENVRAGVGDPKGDPLLGQSFLSRFEAVTQDNKRHVLVLSK